MPQRDPSIQVYCFPYFCYPVLFVTMPCSCAVTKCKGNIKILQMFSLPKQENIANAWVLLVISPGGDVAVILARNTSDKYIGSRTAYNAG